MRVHELIADVRSEILRARARNLTVGFVPTMGALHVGHLSLIEAAKRECDFVVVSIFVNPLQFGKNEDLDRYPRPREADLSMCRNAEVDLVFYPPTEEIYPPGEVTFVEVPELTKTLEGAIRPGHYRGVTTVVAKLFNIVACHRAYFGQKDYQQQLIIRRMVRDLNMPIEIVTCPTMRTPEGLAMSSRNAYLSPDEREQALTISKALFALENYFKGGERDSKRLSSLLQQELRRSANFTIDYAVVVDQETLEESTSAKMVALVAARVGTTRLIDNLLLG